MFGDASVFPALSWLPVFTCISVEGQYIHPLADHNVWCIGLWYLSMPNVGFICYKSFRKDTVAIIHHWLKL